MTLSLTLNRDEEQRLVSYAQATFPAAAALKGLTLNAGHLDAALATPAGKVVARLELVVTDAG